MRINSDSNMDKARIKTRNGPCFDRLNSDRTLLPSLRCVRLFKGTGELRSAILVWRFWRRFEALFASLQGV